MPALRITHAEILGLLDQAITQSWSDAVVKRLQCFLYFAEHGSVTATCRHFGITRKTFYRWLNQFDPKDLRSLEDRRSAKGALPAIAAKTPSPQTLQKGRMCAAPQGADRCPFILCRLARFLQPFWRRFKFYVVLIGILFHLALLLFILRPDSAEASTWNPTLLVNTEAFQILDEGDSTTDIELRFGDDLNEILEWDRANSRFHFTDDLLVDGALSASGSVSFESSLDVSGAISGATIHAEGSLSASGTLFLQGTLTGATVFHGPFTSDCDDATNSKLLWDSSTGKFSCGSDQASGSATWTDGGDFLYPANGEDVVVGGTNEVTFEVKINTGSRISASFSGGLIVNESGNDNDVRMEGDTNQNLLFLDASADRIGIGTASPETTLEVSGTMSGMAVTSYNLINSQSATSGSILVSRSAPAAPEWKAPMTSMVWFIDGGLIVSQTGSAVITMPFGLTASTGSLRVNVAPTGAAVIVDIKKDGTSIYSTKPQIAASAKTSNKTGILSTTDLSAGSVISVSIDQIGSTLAGSGLTIMLTGRRHY